MELDNTLAGDGAIMAELRALYYLLEERQVQGKNRLGSGITIEQSFGAVRKALTKGSLKSMGEGSTHKTKVAMASEFLATKFFSAHVTVRQKPKAYEFTRFEASDVVLSMSPMRAKLECTLLGDTVAITRHALHRQVARVDQNLALQQEDDLSHVPDERFEAAWQWIKRVLINPNTLEIQVRPDLVNKTPLKYGTARYLYFPDSQVPAVLAIVRDATGWVLSTVLRKQQTPFLDWPGYVVGQRLVPAHQHERSRQLRG